MKIENLIEKDTVLDDDYLIVNGTDGTKKAKKSNFLSELNSRGTVISAVKTTPAVYNKDFPVVSINLKAGHTYLVLGHITSDIGNSALLVASVQVDSGGTLFGGGSNYSTMDSGGGTTGYAIVTCESDAVCTLYSYGYINIPYNVAGDIAAIQLD